MSSPPGAGRIPRQALLLMLASLVAGEIARLLPWPAVFAPWGVELVPADSHYYVRFAALQLEAFPRFAAQDPLLNFPAHAEVIWPAGHAWLVAIAELLGGRGRAEAAAAWVGPAASLLWLAVIARMAARAQPGVEAPWTVLVLALAPVAVESGALGNADHHVHEAFLIAAWALTASRAVTLRAPGFAFASGALLGLSRLLTTAWVIDLPLGALAWMATAWVERRASPSPLPARLPVMALSGALLVLLISGAWRVLASGLPLAFPGAYESSDVFALLWALAAGASSVAWSLVLARSPARRWWPWAAVGVGVFLVLWPELARALTHLRTGDPLLAVVDESTPLWRDPLWGARLLGPLAVLVLPVLSAMPAWRAAPPLVPAVTALATLGALSLLQARFLQAFVGAAAVLTGPALTRLARGPRRLLVGVAGVLLFVAGPFQLPQPTPSLRTRLRPSLEWLARNVPAGASASILANYSFGHWLLLDTQRPVLTTTFSQAPVHVEANAAAADILASEDEERAYLLTTQRRVGWVLATPFRDLLGHPEARSRPVLLTRLTGDGGPLPAFAHFRLVHVSAERRRDQPDAPLARVYVPVPGALVRVPCEPGSVTLTLTDPALPQDFRDQRDCREGHLEARLAQPGAWHAGATLLTVTPDDVRLGHTVEPAPIP